MENQLESNQNQSEPKTTEQPQTVDQQNRYVWNGNFNLWFLLLTILSIWFTVGRGIPFFINPEKYGSPKIDWIIGFHLVNAFITVWIMIWNLFHTPSHGPTYRMIHKILGRCSLVTGLLSTIFGFTIVWFTRQLGDPLNSERIGFSIGISIGGFLQVSSQIQGYYQIRKGDVKNHQTSMTFAFFGGCCIPAIMRLPTMLGLQIDSWNYFAWVICLVFGYLSLQAMRAKRII
ncbi:hypothetical protein BC833DRAFT_586613 [Globomyces pollinis-pini]|nr:hypothetical protein BC833DRAFT_586613 [Globomyces pollinis-pini]KAJ2989550.1 hypothetical protein HDV02_004951 [Globomyces sp. JEL0801]